MAMDILLIIVLTICLFTDLRYKKIYNVILVPTALLALGYHLYSGGSAELWWSIKGLLLGMALLFIPFVLGGMGAGDVKLLGVIGAIAGPSFVWVVFLATAMVGGIISLVILIRERRLLIGLKTVYYTFLSLLGLMPRVNMLGTLATAARHGGAFPYGTAITAGTAVAYLVR